MRQLKISQSITQRNETLDKYLQEINRYSMVTINEEVELAQRIRQGDRVAFEKLVTANLRFVVSVAKQYQNQGLSLTDLITEGNIGLLKAAERFDETLGFKFISYAVWWIRQSILQALAEQSRNIRLPLNQVSLVNRINKEVSRFEQLNERRPTSEELSEIMDVPVEKIDEALIHTGSTASLDASFTDGEDNNLLDVLPSRDSAATDNTVMDESLATEIQRVLLTLSPREKEIVQMHFGIGCPEMSLEEIGDHFGLTRERVRQVKEKALRQLRKTSRSTLLKPYL